MLVSGIAFHLFIFNRQFRFVMYIRLLREHRFSLEVLRGGCISSNSLKIEYRRAVGVIKSSWLVKILFKHSLTIVHHVCLESNGEMSCKYIYPQ